MDIDYKDHKLVVSQSNFDRPNRWARKTGQQ